MKFVVNKCWLSYNVYIYSIYMIWSGIYTPSSSPSLLPGTTDTLCFRSCKQALCNLRLQSVMEINVQYKLTNVHCESVMVHQTSVLFIPGLSFGCKNTSSHASVSPPATAIQNSFPVDLFTPTQLQKNKSPAFNFSTPG